jgi:hypothetical protein
MPETIWTIDSGAGPLVATAIHDGHTVREEVLAQMAIPEPNRLREEDPCTGRWAQVAPTRVVGLRSRFEVDLNRPREKAVYLTPADAWGLEVWKSTLPAEIATRSLAQYDAFYQALGQLYQNLADQHGHFVVLDLHTYNHRREGPEGPRADPEANPQVNIGTGTLPEGHGFRPLIDRLMHDLSTFDFPGGKLDVRENVKFRGGQHATWAHQRFPGQACVIAIEFKKFFMCEWSGEPDPPLVDAIGQALACTTAGILEELKKIPR